MVLAISASVPIPSRMGSIEKFPLTFATNLHLGVAGQGTRPTFLGPICDGFPKYPYGSPYSNSSATNPYTTNAPKIYDKQGNYRGRLSKNPYDPESVSNPYGRYGSPYSSDSINNPYGAGNPYSGNEFYLFGEDLKSSRRSE